MSTEHHEVITKTLISAAIALGLWVAVATPASADPNPNPVGTDPNPFSGLSCGCREPAPAGSPELREEIERGIRDGLSADLPGLPASRRGQPRP